jgi:hypothetical protein
MYGSVSAGDTVLAYDRPIAPAVVESQGAMFVKFARMQQEMRSRERQMSVGPEKTSNVAGQTEEDDARLLLVSSAISQEDNGADFTESRPAEAEPSALNLEQMSPPDLVRQLRAMAERVAQMEACMQSHGISDELERPPDYAAQR